MIILLYEITIYLAIAFSLVLDGYVCIKLLLFCHKNKKLYASKFLESCNGVLLAINYVLFIISLVILFKPSSFNILLLSFTYRDVLMVVSIVLIVYFIIRFITLFSTINYMIFAIDENVLNLLTCDRINVTSGSIKTNLLLLYLQNESTQKKYIFALRSKLAKNVLSFAKN